MKNEHKNNLEKQEEMRKEYNLAGKKGIRGKYYEAYRKGHTVKIHQEDGTVNIQHFTIEDGAVMLEPDVREYFSTSEAVNNTLRMLIKLLPQKSTKKKKSATLKKQKTNSK